MSVRAELYDPLLHTRSEDVYDIYATLRRDHPVYFNEDRGVWCLTTYVDVQAAARNWRVFSSLPGGDLDTPNIYGPGNFLDDDPPRHDVLRDVVRPFFVPRAVAGLAQDIARRVDDILSDLRERSHADLAWDFAARLPIWVIARLLGAPETDDEMIQRLVLEVESHEPGQTNASPRGLDALQQLREYLRDLADHKRKYPDGKVLARMVTGEATGVPTVDEVIGMAGVLFAAGTETTFALLTNMLDILAERPATLRRLRSAQSPELIDAAIEEALRYEAPVQYLARTVTTPTSVRGVELPDGARVILVWGAANRDTERWERADEFDIDRVQPRHISFGEGIHFCIGAPLARLEARIALPAFLRTFQSYELGAKRRRNHHTVRGWERLEATLASSE